MAKAKLSYATYITSGLWDRQRTKWVARNHPSTCWSCGGPWCPSDNVHHLTYARLGEEADTDLVALCIPCHLGVHRMQAQAKVDHPKANLVTITHRYRDCIRAGIPPVFEVRHRARYN